MPLPKLKRTTQITTVCGAFLIGLWLAHIGVAITWWVVIAAAFLLVSWKRMWWPIAIVGLAVALGVGRGQLAVRQSKDIARLYGQKVQLTGVITDDPVYTDKNYTEFSMQSQLPGTVKVRSYYVRVQRGYRVSLDGKLEAPLGNQAAQIGFASNVSVLSTQQSWLEKLRQRFFAGMHNALPEPLGSFALGLLMGTRALIPKTLQDQLALVGLSHLVAVSGYNLTILVDATRIKRGSAFVRLAVPLWLIGGFAVVTGFSASIVRAAVVSTLGLLAAHYGRSFKPMVLLGISAVLTTLWQPSYLWADLGWQLSFLAFFGILVVAPTIMERLQSDNQFLALGVESLSAQIVTVPLVIAVFGRLSLVAPFTNVLILPLIPIAMLLSFIAGVAGMLVPHLASWIGLPANWLLQAMISFIQRASTIKWASYNLSLEPIIIAVLYGVVVTAVLLLRRVRYNRAEALGLSDSDKVQGAASIASEASASGGR